MEYIIISISRSNSDQLAFWNANEDGYTSNPFEAGRYSAEKVKGDPACYNDGYNSIAVPVEHASAVKLYIKPCLKAIESFHKTHKL